MTRRCPLCGLNFRFSSELLVHARDDHRTPRVVEREERLTRFLASGREQRRTYAPSM
jgi:hypothetical protein